MHTAYDPTRIRELSVRTVAAIDALSMISSSDPAAAEALRTVRLLRHNLEDLWMPLLRQIEASRAMISWTASAAGSVMEFAEERRRLLGDWIHAHDDLTYAEQLRSMSDPELLHHLGSFDTDSLPLDADYQLDLHDERWLATFPTVAAEMARRVRDDARFAARLVGAADRNPVIGLAVGHADFPIDFTYDVATVMLHGRSWMDDLEARAGAAATNAALAELASSPTHALALLGDPTSLEALAAWHLLDPVIVADIVHCGLYEAVAADPSRLREGYGVLEGLTRLANGSLDDGFTPGVARGVANSMIGYVDTLGRGIGAEDGGDVRVTTIDEHPFTIELGTYEEVRELFGAMARDLEAQAALGVVLGAYMNTVTERVGQEIGSRTGVEEVAQFADLIGDAVTAEQAEMVAVATAAATRWGILAGAIGFASSTAVSSLGAGPVVGLAVTRVIKMGTDNMSEPDPEIMPNGLLRHVAYDAILVATVSLARSDAATRPSHGMRDQHEDLAVVDSYLSRLAELDADGDAGAYHDHVSDMADYIAQRTPELDEFVNEVMTNAAVSELREDHS